MIQKAICIVLLVGNSIVAQSLQERLALALDPLKTGGGTVLASRLMLLHHEPVELTGQVIGSKVNKIEPYKGIDNYEQFIDDTDLNFNIHLDERSIKKLETLGIKLTEEQVEEGVECESVAFARAFSSKGKPELPVFPGWRDEKWNVKFNGKPFWTNWTETEKLWNSLRTDQPRVSVTGVLVIDCGNCQGNHPYGRGVTKDCVLNNTSKIELHPVYEIRVIDG